MAKQPFFIYEYMYLRGQVYNNQVLAFRSVLLDAFLFLHLLTDIDMDPYHLEPPQKTGIIGGTLVVLLANISNGDVLKVAVQAALGALVSFVVSWVLNYVMKRRRKV